MEAAQLISKIRSLIYFTEQNKSCFTVHHAFLQPELKIESNPFKLKLSINSAPIKERHPLNHAMKME